MCKKMKITVLAAMVLMMISGAAFARGGHGGYGHGNYRGHGGGRNYRPAYRHCDYRPVYRPVRYGYRPCARPVYVYPSNGIIISTGSIIIGLGF